MFIKTLYGEVENNAWYGQDVTFEEVSSVAEAQSRLLEHINLNHDYPEEWLTSDVERARTSVNSLQEDEGKVRIRSIQANEGETYSVYEYSIVAEKD